MTYSTNWSRFVIRYALAVVAVAVFIYVMQKFLNYNMRSSGATLVPIILVSMMEGTAYAKAERALPKGAWAWQQSVLFGLVGMGVTMGCSAIFMSALPGMLGYFLTPVGFSALSIVTGVMMVFFVLGARFSFWMGARNELKAQARNAGHQE
ncbi:hypothetical protein PEL8287_03148 [Roseovarius litorisediminis]|uniref:Uncharacterized protein n=1 Tax=Roseovarius litorisediminis TaxID=1312363 RepID=A0A1Y5TCC9_9RHOB|nr:ABZJ_00895 family protein [Roseovarius litorisediminis]SLN58647.1 hypothetical protein PEL8287_03148 [Roseovarius litorisediminis]